MSATYILATDRPELLREWWVLVPPGRQVITLEEWSHSAAMLAGVPLVVVLDVGAAHRFPVELEKHPIVLVGGNETPVEQSRHYGLARVFLSYEESRQRLAQLLPLIEEIAMHRMVLQMQTEKVRRADAGKGQHPALSPAADWPQIWDFLESALENVASRDRLLDEFRRIVRRLMRVSQVLFFLRDGGGFKSDHAEFACPQSEPLISYWAAHPAPLDGVEWPATPEPSVEMSVRQRLAQWGVRLLVPIHDNARLQGFIALGVKMMGGRICRPIRSSWSRWRNCSGIFSRGRTNWCVCRTGRNQMRAPARRRISMFSHRLICLRATFRRW
jgi:hypothetical protein